MGAHQAKNARWFVVYKDSPAPWSREPFSLMIEGMARKATAVKWAADRRTLGMFSSKNSAVRFKDNFWRTLKEKANEGDESTMEAKRW